jgi:hypothetical protein
MISSVTRWEMHGRSIGVSKNGECLIRNPASVLCGARRRLLAGAALQIACTARAAIMTIATMNGLIGYLHGDALAVDVAAVADRHGQDAK